VPSVSIEMALEKIVLPVINQSLDPALVSEDCIPLEVTLKAVVPSALTLILLFLMVAELT
jgi:hypothetical protein